MVLGMKTTTEIYNQLTCKRGQLAAFSKYLVEEGLYKDIKNANQGIRFGTNNPKISELYETWKNGRVVTKDTEKYNDKLKEVFQNIKTKGLKQELTDVRDVLEYALMELTLGIKNGNKEQLLKVKDILQDAIYKETT